MNNNNHKIIQLTINYDIVLSFDAIDYETGEEIKHNFQFFK